MISIEALIAFAMFVLISGFFLQAEVSFSKQAGEKILEIQGNFSKEYCSQIYEYLHSGSFASKTVIQETCSGVAESSFSNEEGKVTVLNHYG
ncbi:MAG: hypothetical protein Q7K42_01900 [Candidatus Diapherotrites archaeon]|nr:hypothetical protein [Candidatus Diapherotrites archaeon]